MAAPAGYSSRCDDVADDDLHPYDGTIRRFRHDDADASRRARGSALVARLLGLPAPPRASGLRYDLSFLSDGCGVYDRLYIALPCGPGEVDAMVARLGFATPEAIVADEMWRDDFENLVLSEEEPRSLREAVVAFVEHERTSFQARPGEHARIWFDPQDTVNDWTVVYEEGGELCFIGFSQG
jgi:hypothetical protein